MNIDDSPSDRPQSVPETGSDDQPQPDASAGRRSRNPLEKFIVWGLIAGLAGLAGFEAFTRFSHRKTVDTVDDAFRSSARRVADFLRSDAVLADVQARIDQGMSLEAADAAAIAAAIESNPEEGRRLTLAQAEDLISGFPIKTTQAVSPVIHGVTYRWQTPLKDYGGIQIRYQIESGEIVKLTDFNAGDEL